VQSIIRAAKGNKLLLLFVLKAFAHSITSAALGHCYIVICLSVSLSDMCTQYSVVKKLLVNERFHVCDVEIGSKQWQRSEPESEHSRVNVSGLSPGQAYHLRVVALGRIGNRNDVTSQPQQVVVGLPRGRSHHTMA